MMTFRFRPNNTLTWHDMLRCPFIPLDGDKYTKWTEWDDKRKEKLKSSYRIWLRNNLIIFIYWVFDRLYPIFGEPK